MIRLVGFSNLPPVRARNGQTISLSAKVPDGILGVDGIMDWLQPPWGATRALRDGRIDAVQFTQQYGRYLKQPNVWVRVEEWLKSLTDNTYLCSWEREGFCHRLLVAALIRRYRPDLEVWCDLEENGDTPRSGGDMPTMREAYFGLWTDSPEYRWEQEPADFGLDAKDAEAEVCELCLWHGCDSCSFAQGDWRQVGPPALAKLLDAEEYFDELPPRDQVRNWDEEEPETTEFVAGAVVKHRMGAMQVIVGHNRTIQDAVEMDGEQEKIDAEVEKHRAFQTREKEASMTDNGNNGRLVLVADGGKRGDGTTYGSVQVGPINGAAGRIVRREWGRIAGPHGSHNVAEYKALVNALYLARIVVEKLGAEAPALVEIRMDSKLVVNQVLGNWKCKAEHLVAFRDRATREFDALLVAMRTRRPDKAGRVQLAWVPRDQVEAVLGH